MHRDGSLGKSLDRPKTPASSESDSPLTPIDAERLKAAFDHRSFPAELQVVVVQLLQFIGVLFFVILEMFVEVLEGRRKLAYVPRSHTKSEEVRFIAGILARAESKSIEGSEILNQAGESGCAYNGNKLPLIGLLQI